MLLHTRTYLAAGLILAITPFAKTVYADDPTTQQLAEQVRQLQAKVDRLEANAPAAATTQPVVPYTQNGANETESHPKPGLDPMDTVGGVGGFKSPVPTTGAIPNFLDVGWDGSQFTIGSADGNFTLHPSITLDIRNDTSWRTHVPAKNGSEVLATGTDIQNGFDLTRARFIFDGTLFHQVGYFFQLQADQGVSLSLLDAYVTYRFGDSPISFKAGQFKDPYSHERNVSEATLLAVDRSMLDQILGGGQGSRIQGAALTYDRDRLRAQVVAHDGFNSLNTKFFDSGGVGAGVGGESGVTPTDFGFSGRAEFLAIGHRTKQFNPYTEYDQFTSRRATQDILVIGGGADYTQAGDNDVMVHTIDAQFNSTCGLALYGAYLGTYRDVHTNQGVPAGHYYDPGFLVQAAYLIDQKFEPFVRYDYTHLDPASTLAVTGLKSHLVQELTIGGNYYLYGQKFKFTLDGSWLPNGSPVDADGLGVLKDSGHPEYTLRGQLQLSI